MLTGTFERLLLDYLVGKEEDRGRDGEAERLGGLEVDVQFECGRLLGGETGGGSSAENFLQQARDAQEGFLRITRIIEKRPCPRKRLAEARKGWRRCAKACEIIESASVSAPGSGNV